MTMTFNETQKFTQAWLWVVVIGCTLLPALIFGFGSYRQIVLGRPFGNNPMSDTGMIISFLAVVLLSILMVFLICLLKLTTVIDEEGIKYKFFPFHFKHRKITWIDIEKCEVVKYDPIREYGGWGIRYGKEGKAFNVSGNKGLKIYLRSGKKLLLGTRKEDELQGFLLNSKHS